VKNELPWLVHATNVGELPFVKKICWFICSHDSRWVGIGMNSTRRVYAITTLPKFTFSNKEIYTKML